MNLFLSHDLQRNYRDWTLNLGIESANAAYAYNECIYVCMFRYKTKNWPNSEP